MAATPTKKGGGGNVIKKILPIVIAVPLVFALLGGGVFLGTKLAAPSAAAADGEHGAETHGKEEPKKKAEEEPKGTGPILLLKERVVNLAEPMPGGPRFVKFAVSVEFKPEKPEYYKKTGAEKKKYFDEFQKEMAPLQPLIEDAIVMTVSAKKAVDLQTPAGRERLKIELLHRIESVMSEPEVVNVYFTEFVMQ